MKHPKQSDKSSNVESKPCSVAGDKMKTDWNTVFLGVSACLASVLIMTLCHLSSAKTKLEQQHQSLLDCTNQINSLQSALDRCGYRYCRANSYAVQRLDVGNIKPCNRRQYPAKWELE